MDDPSIIGSGSTTDNGNFATIKFSSGPNLNRKYSVACFSAPATDAPVPSCGDLGNLTPDAIVAGDDLPKLSSSVTTNITGLYSEVLDCYVAVEDIAGKWDKCQWAGRVSGPWDAYIDTNGVTVKCPGVEMGDTFVLNGVEYTRRDRNALQALVTGDQSLLETSCTTGVVDMSSLFGGQGVFNGDISTWDTSSVQTMDFMFSAASAFNQPIGVWDTSSVQTMAGMFSGATAFNQPIGEWDTSSVQSLFFMFLAANAFNQPIGGWDTSSVQNMAGMFGGAHSFNQPIGDWDTSSVENMIQMFMHAGVFDQDINDWDTSSVVSMQQMFYGARFFNQDLSSWTINDDVKADASLCEDFRVGALEWADPADFPPLPNACLA